MVRLSFSKREKKREHVSGGGMESREEEEKHQGTATHIHVRGWQPEQGLYGGWLERGNGPMNIEIEGMQLEAEQG